MTTTKIALITGANRGIGKEIARQFAELGSTVVVGSRDLARGPAVAKELTEDGLDAVPVQLEVTAADSVSAAAGWIDRTYGRLDVLVNNAAILPAGDAAVSEIDAGTLRDAFEVNVVGLVQVTQAMLPLLRKADAARIVNLSTSLASFSQVGDPESGLSSMLTLAYNASKAASNMVTVMLATELRATAILVNGADPGTAPPTWAAGTPPEPRPRAPPSPSTSPPSPPTVPPAKFTPTPAASPGNAPTPTNQTATEPGRPPIAKQTDSSQESRSKSMCS